MNFKKRVNGSWTNTPHYIHNTSTDIITTLPANIYPNAASATVELKGNMQQNGTATPQNPIQPQETGEIENLTGTVLDNSTISTDNNGTWQRYSGSGKTTYYPCAGGIYYLAIPNDYTGFVRIYYSTSSTVPTTTTNVNVTGVVREDSPSTHYYTFNVPTNAVYIVLQFSASLTEYVLTNSSLNKGYKIPILNNSQTTNVYLGEVQTTRRIKKYEFTGNEDWFASTAQSGRFGFALSDYLKSNLNVTSVCSHYVAVEQRTSGSVANNSQYFYSGNDSARYIFIVDERYTTAADFKTYLQQQYAAGTPVTVWYVLATPQTAVVNEPLRKIGNYADEVSGITIPTIAGANTLSIGTTLQPSEVTATYKGWHPVQSVHVYPDSSWLPTSWEEFRKAVRSGKAQSLYPVGTKLYENWGDTTSDAWIVVDYPTGEDYLDSDLAQQGYTNRVMLMEEKLNYLRQFDAIEAWLYVETAIPAGTYRFTIPNYDVSYGGNKTYIFTSTANVPVGGQLTLTWTYQRNPSAVQAYSSATSTSALFNVSITEWDGTTACTDLGTIKLAQNDPDSTYGKLNHIHRARYGSNNYYQSGYRQWLNTNASANWWTPTNVFDRPYSNRTNAGRLNVMNSNMKSVLAIPTVNCITNNLFEYPSLDGTTFSLQTAYTVTDKLFPVTHSEINLSSSPNVNSVLDYYVGKGNADRIKYRKDNGNAYYWWLRTPYPTYADVVRSVHTSGALHTNSAYSALGSAAACIIQ